MSIEAMYSLEFAAPGDGDQVWFGAGVIILDTGRIFGGDHTYAYVGTYEIDTHSSGLTAEVRVFVHSRLIGVNSIFGTPEEEFFVRLNGTTSFPECREITLSGSRREDGGARLAARTRRPLLLTATRRLTR